MTVSLLPFLAFALVASATPGPNNIMVFAAAAAHGLRPTVPLVLGIVLGFGLLVAVVGSGLAGPLASYRPLHLALRFVAAGWLLVLAWQIARAGSPALRPRKASGAPLGFWGGCAFQWVNPKAWIIALAVTATYTTPDGNLYRQVILLAAILVVISLPCVAGWAALGAGAGRLLASPARLRAFNLAMAALLVASVVAAMLE